MTETIASILFLLAWIKRHGDADAAPVAAQHYEKVEKHYSESLAWEKECELRIAEAAKQPPPSDVESAADSSFSAPSGGPAEAPASAGESAEEDLSSKPSAEPGESAATGSQAS